MKKDFYKSAIKEFPVGYACYKMICDENDLPYDYEFVEVNPYFERFIGKTEEELIGKRVTDVYPEIHNLKTKWIDIFGKIGLHGGTEEFEQYSETLGIWFRVKAVCPEKYYCITYVRDISKEQHQRNELKNLEAIVEQNEFKYKSITQEKGVWEKRLHEIANVLRLENDVQFQRIIENLPFVVSIISNDGIVLYANTKGFEFYEMGPEIIGKKLGHEFWLDKEKKKRWEQELEEYGVAKDYEIHLKTVSGRESWAIGSGIAIQYKGYESVLAAQYDITQRKFIEAALKESEREYRLLFENAVEAIIVVQQGKLKICNPMAEKLMGYTKEELLSMHVLEFVHPEEKEEAFECYRIREGSDTMCSEHVFRFIRKDKQIIWVETKGIQIEWNGETAVLYFMLDITERKNATDALSSSEEKYRLIAEFASDVIWVYNITLQKFTYISPSIFSLRGLTTEEALAETLEDALTPESLDYVIETMERVMPEFLKDPENTNYYINEIRQPCKNGDIIWIEISTRIRFNKIGEVEVIGVSRNIEERKKSEREVLYLSYHDEITGLFNRRFYEEELHRINIKRNLPVTLVMADVNGLKLTNDAFGHLAGDNLLRTFSEILKRELRAEDVAARIGGDEFALLLPKTSYKETEKIIERIKTAMKNEPQTQTILSVSFGWATKEIVEENFQTLYMQAEDNMYREKLVESATMKSATIPLVMKSLYEIDPTEKKHCLNVAKICKKIGKEIGLARGELSELELFAMLHDIGKIGIHKNILTKPTDLTENEWLEIKRHPEIGYQILRSSDDFVRIADYVLSHHERIDGNGYPRNIKGTDIPLQARILAVAEAYDAMRNPRGSRKPLGEEEIKKEFHKNEGKQFDREITKIFIEKVLGKSNNEKQKK